MRVLVTGGAGFIGSNCVYALLANGLQVNIIDNLSTGSARNIHPAATFHRIDITSPELKVVMCDIRPEVVIHLAAQVSVAASIEDPAHDWNVNVEGARAVAEAAVASGVRRVLFASSAAVYGEPHELPLTEESPAVPVVPYGRSKIAAEKVLSEVLRPAGVDFACLRFANVYGPRQCAQGEGGVVAEFAARMIAGITPVVFGTGAQTRDFIFVADAVNACIMAAEFDGLLAAPGSSGPAYNISTGRETAVSALAEGLRNATGYTGAIEHARVRQGDVEASCLSPEKAARSFGWQAAVELQDGLTATAMWFAQDA